MAVGFLVATLASITFLVIGLMAVLGRLPPGHFAGLPAASVRKNEEAWMRGHRAGSIPLIFTAVAATAIGLALLPFSIAGELSRPFSSAMIALQGLLILGGVIAAWKVGTRAASSVED
jgi:hypothetical protein